MHDVVAPYNEGEPDVDSTIGKPPENRSDGRRRWGGRLLALGAFLMLGGGLAFGASRHYAQY